MQLESKKYLFDIQQAATRVAEFVKGKDLSRYESDPMLRAAEALRRLLTEDPTTAVRISEHRRIIAFRNILVHGYADIDDRIVWGILESSLPTLLREVDLLLK